MKKIAICLISLFTIGSCQNQNKSLSNHAYVQEQIKTIKDTDKILILEFWAPTCGSCIRLKNDVFENEQHTPFLKENFVLIKISPSDSRYNSLFKFYNLQAQSSVLYFNNKGVEIDRTAGYDGNKEGYIHLLEKIAQRKSTFSDVLKKYMEDTTSIQNNYLMAHKLLLRSENQKAMQHFNYILKQDSSDAYGYHAECAFRLAEYGYEQLGNIDQLKEYVKAYSSHEYAPQAYLSLVNYYKNNDEHKNSVLTSAEALRKFPFNPEVLNKHAWNIYVFKIEEDYPEALNLVKKALEFAPDKAGYWDTQAWLYHALGENKKAVQSEKKAIKLFPHQAYKEALKEFESV